jgi:hypothetical protein
MENGFKMWSFHGRLLFEASKDRLFQVRRRGGRRREGEGLPWLEKGDGMREGG